MILLGDMEPAKPLHRVLERIVDRVWWIPGNHDADSDELWHHVWDSELAHRNLHGKVVTLPDGTRIAGLGGVFREAVWYPTAAAARAGAPAFPSAARHGAVTPRQDRWQGEGPHRRHWGTIYPDVFEALADEQADVLVTHEAPGYHPHGFELLDALAQAMGVSITVHGHQHDALDSSGRWTEQGFRSFGVGLRGLTVLDKYGTAQIIKPGELDAQRQTRQD